MNQQNQRSKKSKKSKKSFKSAVIFAPMKMNKILRAAIILFILALNIGCDQVSKSIVRKDMHEYQVIGYLGNHFTLEKVENTGAFLSLGDTLGGPVHFVLLVVLPVVALLFGLGYILVKTNLDKYRLLAIILIIGGGVGNLYDRIMHGSVTDFMHIDFIIFQTGIFNVADMSIMAGMFIIIIDSFIKGRKEKLSQAKTA
jgi:signal peptidase II